MQNYIAAFYISVSIWKTTSRVFCAQIYSIYCLKLILLLPDSLPVYFMVT